MNAETNQIFDGYRLIRFIGRGGFGEVWLCRSEAMGDYRALKIIPSTSASHLQKEYESLLQYRKAAAQLRSPHILAIEHVNLIDAGLFYIMPLADGIGAEDPADPDWVSVTLAQKIHHQKDQALWFSSAEIIDMMLPILAALQTLSDAGLIHRDVKPENILFYQGKPCLGDISLLGSDSHAITHRGTPGYVTPSWYVGGQPDMYSAAATLYHLLTGNLPDKMGRSAFIWPPQGEKSLQESERAEWKRFHSVIRRATEEMVAERYVDFRTMAMAISGAVANTLPSSLTSGKSRSASARLMAVVFGILILVALAIFAATRPAKPKDQPAALVSVAPSQVPQPTDAKNQAFIDAQTACSSLTWLQAYLPTWELSPSQTNLFHNTLSAIYENTCVPSKFAPELAVRKLDICLDAIKKMSEIPNVRLARLLLQQAAGQSDEVAKGITDPAFTTPGSDNIEYRIVLLCRLHAADKAEALLDRALATTSLTALEKSELLIRRADVRAQLGKYPETHVDVTEVLAATEQDEALKADVQMKLLKLESDHPGYADYLKTHPQK